MNRLIIGGVFAAMFAILQQYFVALCSTTEQSGVIVLIFTPMLLTSAVIALYGLRAMIRAGDFDELVIILLYVWGGVLKTDTEDAYDTETYYESGAYWYKT